MADNEGCSIIFLAVFYFQKLTSAIMFLPSYSHIVTSKIHTDSNISNGDFSSYIEKNITEYYFSSQH